MLKIIGPKIGRNDPCPCGSEKKYKKCCLGKEGTEPSPVDLKAVNELLQKGQSPQPEPHINIVPSLVWKGFRWRTIWGTLHYKRLSETFHEFIIDLLKGMYGEPWRQQQMALPPNERHAVIHWVESYQKWKVDKTGDAKRDDAGSWGAIPTGDVKALHAFAYDLYCLQVVNKLPEFMIPKLKNRKEFQGVRYEVAVAAIIARAGFEITFLDDIVKSQKHCEFIARHKISGIEIGVEAKSRRRSGVLHEVGTFDPDKDIKGDVHRLFQKAKDQKPAGLPYLIFIDLNLPSSREVLLEKRPWFEGVKKMLDGEGDSMKENPDPYNAIVLTNFAYYYGGNTGDAPSGEYCFVIPKFSEIFCAPEILNEIWESLARYALIPKEI